MSAAFAATFAVLVEAALAWALAAAALRGRVGRPGALAGASLGAGIVAGLLAAVAGARRGLTGSDVALALAPLRLLFAAGLLAVAVAARRVVELPAAGTPRARLTELAVAVAGAAFAPPQAAALGYTLREAAVLAGGWERVVAGAALAAAAAAGVALGLRGLAARAGLERLAPPALAAALFAVTMAGGAAAAVELPPLARGFTAVASRSIHDGFHLAFVLLQLPDHPYLTDPVYQLILSFLEPLPHALIAAAGVALPFALAGAAFARRPAPAPPPGARPPARRLARAGHLSRTRLAVAAFAVAIAVTGSAIVGAHLASEDLYDPVPEPVVDDGKGTVVVPLGGPLAGSDRRMRKFVWASAGRAIAFFAVRRADGTFAVALDLCEICQPKGYAQLGAGYVYCKYCKTPIPVGTVGQPGGCNPVPLPSARVEGGVLRVPASELAALHERILTEKR
jgi:hypothetical protein